jgi:hypothetical protein
VDHVVLLDGKEPTDVKPGVPTESLTTLRLFVGEVGRPVMALFNQDRIVARAWPASENRIAIAELPISHLLKFRRLHGAWIRELIVKISPGHPGDACEAVSERS